MDRGTVQPAQPSGLIGFNRHPVCLKCRGVMMRWTWVPSSHHYQIIPCTGAVAMGDAGEHLDVTCMDCGYKHGMEVAR